VLADLSQQFLELFVHAPALTFRKLPGFRLVCDREHCPVRTRRRCASPDLLAVRVVLTRPRGLREHSPVRALLQNFVTLSLHRL
jgi:hypothetical protein